MKNAVFFSPLARRCVLAAVYALLGTAVMSGGDGVLYSENFDGYPDGPMPASSGITVIDVNNDAPDNPNCAWNVLSGRARVFYNATLDMDDWMITPGVAMEAGKYYLLKFDMAGNAVNIGLPTKVPEKLGVSFGSAPTAEGMTATVMETVELIDDLTHHREIFVCPEEDGIYYIGFHGCSPMDGWNLFVDNISIDEGLSGVAPAAVEGLVLEPATDGSLSCKISFTAPRRNIAGVEMSGSIDFSLYRDGVQIGAVTGFPGSEVVMTDGDCPQAGEHTYAVVGSVGGNAGVKVSATDWIGINRPAIPATVTVNETPGNPGEVTITWDAVTTDINGRQLLPEFVTYKVLTRDRDNNIVTLVEDYDNTSYTCRVVDADSYDLVNFGVKAVTSAGESTDGRTSNMLPVGLAAGIPWHESWAGGESTQNVWAQDFTDGDASWSIYDDSGFNYFEAQDGDNGYTAFEGYEPTHSASLMSRKISLEGAVNPTVSLWGRVFCAPEATLDIYACAGGESILVKHVEAADFDDEGWNKIEAPLSGLEGKEIFLRLVASHNGSQRGNFIIDNLKVASLHKVDIEGVEVSVPETVKSNRPFAVKATFRNNGSEPLGEFAVDLYRDGVKIATAAAEGMDRDAVSVAVFTDKLGVTDPAEVSYYAVAVSSEEGYEADNATPERSAVHLYPEYPVPALSALADDMDVVLSWDAPDTTPADPQRITESFEEYDLYSTTFGDWGNIDDDKLPIWGEFTGAEDGTLQGWWVTDIPSFEESGLPIDPIDGDQFLMQSCVAASDDPEEENGGVASDWLISPELTGEAQTIGFYARGAYYDETMRVGYSTTDAMLDSFTFFEDEDVPYISYDDDNNVKVWKDFEYDLPAGAKYFAIGCVTDDGLAMMVDAISFTPTPERFEVEGYNLYRDGELIASPEAGETGYVDRGLTAGRHVYRLSVRYAKQGESQLSREASVELSGVENVSCDAADATLPTEYYNLNGMQVASPGAGVYIMRHGDKVEKVVIK